MRKLGRNLNPQMPLYKTLQIIRKHKNIIPNNHSQSHLYGKTIDGSEIEINYYLSK